MQCGVCGGKSFTFQRISWEKLANEWQLSPVEVSYIDRQQGKTCDQCGANLRSIALANALRAFIGTNLTLKEVASSPSVKDLAILEINQAGTLHPILKTFSNHTFGTRNVESRNKT